MSFEAPLLPAIGPLLSRLSTYEADGIRPDAKFGTPAPHLADLDLWRQQVHGRLARAEQLGRMVQAWTAEFEGRDRNWIASLNKRLLTERHAEPLNSPFEDVSLSKSAVAPTRTDPEISLSRTLARTIARIKGASSIAARMSGPEARRVMEASQELSALMTGAGCAELLLHHEESEPGTAPVGFVPLALSDLGVATPNPFEYRVEDSGITIRVFAHDRVVHGRNDRLTFLSVGLLGRHDMLASRARDLLKIRPLAVEAALSFCHRLMRSRKHLFITGWGEAGSIATTLACCLNSRADVFEPAIEPDHPISANGDFERISDHVRRYVFERVPSPQTFDDLGMSRAVPDTRGFEVELHASRRSRTERFPAPITAAMEAVLARMRYCELTLDAAETHVGKAPGRLGDTLP